MPEVKVGSVPFTEAIEHFRGKLKIPTESWDDMLGEVHAKAFTVAGATKADLLIDLHTAVSDAITNGTTITEFRKQFDHRAPVLRANPFQRATATSATTNT